MQVLPKGFAAAMICTYNVGNTLLNLCNSEHTLLLSFTSIVPGPSSLPLGNIINAHHHSMSDWMARITVTHSNDLLGSRVDYHSSH
jgi:hypothetical protein